VVFAEDLPSIASGGLGGLTIGVGPRKELINWIGENVFFESCGSNLWAGDGRTLYLPRSHMIECKAHLPKMWLVKNIKSRLN